MHKSAVTHRNSPTRAVATQVMSPTEKLVTILTNVPMTRTIVNTIARTPKDRLNALVLPVTPLTATVTHAMISTNASPIVTTSANRNARIPMEVTTALAMMDSNLKRINTLAKIMTSAPQGNMIALANATMTSARTSVDAKTASTWELMERHAST